MIGNPRKGRFFWSRNRNPKPKKVGFGDGPQTSAGTGKARQGSPVQPGAVAGVNAVKRRFGFKGLGFIGLMGCRVQGIEYRVNMAYRA